MIEELASAQAHAALRRLRAQGPVVWVDTIDGWLVVGRDTAISALRQSEVFTVDDPRFSTAVVVGPSMLSTDGPEHLRQRGAFAPLFGVAATTLPHAPDLDGLAHRMVAGLADRGSADLRTELAGPLAVAVIIEVLGLIDADSDAVLDWYRSIVEGVERVSLGLPVASATAKALGELRRCVENSSVDPGGLASVASALSPDELFSNTAVVMFGAIETSEGMTSNALWHLLTVPDLRNIVAEDRSRVPDLIEESLRLEPAAAVVDRYATRDTRLGDVDIAAGDLVRISLAGANRDPSTFSDPDTFDLDRANSRQHLAFVNGPHACIGTHVARAQTAAAINAVLDGLPAIEVDPAKATPPTGLIFRKPQSLRARWVPTRSSGPASDPAG